MDRQPRTWPVLSGTIPLLAPGFNRRPETGHGLGDALHPGRTVILGPDGALRTLAGREGTGKTQLAAAFAHRLWASGDLDMLAWLDAGSRDGIITGYARTLADIRVAAPAGKPEAAADRLLTWLAETRRRWLVVLDGLADPADAEGLMPSGPSGQTLVTTLIAEPSSRSTRPGAAMRLAASDDAQGLRVAVPAFSQREALQYLSDRLDDDPYQSGGAVDLAGALGGQPVALDLSVAYLLDTGANCRQYRLAYEQYSQNWANGFGGDPLAPVWMLAVDRAQQFAPTDLAWPTLKLATVLGRGWIPGAVVTSAAACAYITGRRAVTAEDQAAVRASFGNLERVGLASVEPDDDIRTVRLPAALQSSVRRVIGPAEIRKAVQSAADALVESWPEGNSSDPSVRARTEQALRDCAASLRRCDEPALWAQGCHPLLARVGQSLDDARMVVTAHAYWRDLARRCSEAHGVRSPLSLELRERLAGAAMAAGLVDEAISVREELASDMDEVAGPTDRQAISSRARLVLTYRMAGRLSEAITLGIRVAADSERVLGSAHAQTTASVRELARAYCDAGRYPESLDVLQLCLARAAEMSGAMHPDTASVRAQLAQALRRAGRAADAIKLYQQTLAQVEKAVGAAHPDALTARGNLAIAYYLAGRNDEATASFERAVADWRRVPGSTPALTMVARINLAATFCLNGRPKQAVQLYEGVLADTERLRGAAHPDTFRARWSLAAAYHHAKRLPVAVELGEATLAASEELLGPGHPHTLTTRANLAHAYHAAGRLKRASAHFDRALRDCEQALDPDDPLTVAVRELRQRYLAGRQGVFPIVAPPGDGVEERAAPARARAAAARPTRTERARHAHREALPAPR